MTDKREIVTALAEYKARHAAQYGIEQLGLFGSYARGEQKESSDIDVFVSVARPTLNIVCTIHDDLESLFHHKVDLVRIRPNMNQLLRSNIQRDGILA